MESTLGIASLGLLICALVYSWCFCRRSSPEEPPSDEYV
jgi:hypothetical protein